MLPDDLIGNLDDTKAVKALLVSIRLTGLHLATSTFVVDENRYSTLNAAL